MSADKDFIPRARPSRKRAPTACLSCRSRKVRCDVFHRGQPCLNCYVDKEKCVVKGRPTKYQAHRARASTQQPRDEENLAKPSSPPTSKQTQSQSQQLATENLAGEVGDRWRQSLEPKASHDHHDALDENRFLEYCVEESSKESPMTAGPTDQNRRESFVEEIKPECKIQASTGCLTTGSFQETSAEADAELVLSAKSHVLFSYYPFLEPDNMSQMLSRDVNILEEQGCFRVPIRQISDVFVRQYFLHVHPSLPMVDEGAFWDMYSQQGSVSMGSQRLSLFLFQCMLFAASSFVAPAIIRQAGFRGIRQARHAYYRRAKALFNSEGERSSLATAQGALLLSYHVQSRNITNNTYWLETAIHHGRDAQAHRYQTKQNLLPPVKNALKRLWWCCILRDRIIPLGVRRPLKIGADDFDFGVDPITANDFASEIEHSKVYDPRTKSILTDLFIALCELAVSLTDVIKLIYPLKGSFDTTFSTEQSSQAFCRIATCESRLDRWYEGTIILFPTPAGIRDAHESIVLYTNLLYIYYHSAKVALSHHSILVATSSHPNGGLPFERIYDIQSHLEEAVGGITENLKELIQLKLTKYMPVSAVAYTALPLVLHVLDVKLSTTSSQSALKQRRLDIYTEAMKALQTQYDGTDHVSDAIVKMVDNIKLDNKAMDLGKSARKNNLEDNSLSHVPTNIWGPNPVRNWGDVLVRQPSCYLRMVLTVDLALSAGKFPNESDFPISLQSQKKLESTSPQYMILLNGASPKLNSRSRLCDHTTHEINSPDSENSSQNQGYSLNAMLGVPYELQDLDQRFLNQNFNIQDMDILEGMEMPLDLTGFDSMMPQDESQVDYQSWPDEASISTTHSLT